MCVPYLSGVTAHVARWPLAIQTRQEGRNKMIFWATVPLAESRFVTSWPGSNGEILAMAVPSRTAPQSSGTQALGLVLLLPPLVHGHETHLTLGAQEQSEHSVQFQA